MKINDYKAENTITAIAMVLAKSELTQDTSNQANICLKVFLGQKKSLIKDSNKFSLFEIIPMNAAGNLAIIVSESINTNDQIKFTARITRNSSKEQSLVLLKIEKQNNG